MLHPWNIDMYSHLYDFVNCYSFQIEEYGIEITIKT